MGRSVNRLNNSLHVLYLEYDTPSEKGDEDHFQSGTDEWENFVDFIQKIIENKYISFSRVEHKWDNNETIIILENDHAIIGISEYENIVSISIAINPQDHTIEALSHKWIDSIWNNLDKLFRKTFSTRYLNRLGSFSNGESIYQTLKEELTSLKQNK